MSLAHPVLLVLGVLLTGAFGYAVLVLERRRSAALRAAGMVVGGRTPRSLGRWLTVAGVLVLAVAAAGPAAALPVARSAGTVVLAMDVSNSMAADDVEPNRLAAAQRAALALIDAQPDNVDVGVVGFEQGALTTSVPSPDREASRAAVEALRTSGGTSLSAAILGALSAITGTPVAIAEDGTLPELGYWGSATIVLLSDGGDTSADDEAGTAAATLAQNAGVHIETVGVGTPAGATVEVDGFRLQTVLDAERLTTIAETTGGRYHPASDAAELDGVASTIDLRLTVAEEDVPLAGGLIAVALALLVAGAVLTVLRTGRLV